MSRKTQTMINWLAKSLTATCTVIVTIQRIKVSKEMDDTTLSTEELPKENTKSTVAESNAEYEKQSGEGYLGWGGESSTLQRSPCEIRKVSHREENDVISFCFNILITKNF